MNASPSIDSRCCRPFESFRRCIFGGGVRLNSSIMLLLLPGPYNGESKRAYLSEQISQPTAGDKNGVLPSMGNLFA